MRFISRLVLAVAAVAFSLGAAGAQDAGMKKWTKGKGWGWVWGPQDEVGNLNEMTDASRLEALRLVTQGKAYDLGLPYDREMARPQPGGGDQLPVASRREESKGSGLHNA